MEHIHLLFRLSTQVTLRLLITSGLAEDHPPRPRPRLGYSKTREAKTKTKTSKSGLDRSRDQDQFSRPTSLLPEQGTVPSASSLSNPNPKHKLISLTLNPILTLSLNLAHNCAVYVVLLCCTADISATLNPIHNPKPFLDLILSLNHNRSSPGDLTLAHSIFIAVKYFHYAELNVTYGDRCSFPRCTYNYCQDILLHIWYYFLSGAWTIYFTAAIFHPPS